MAAVLFKVFTLGIRTLARPVGNGFQAWALQHPAFRQQCIKVAQLIHKTEVWITRGAEGKEGKAFVGAITEEKGMELASKLVSEGFVFTVGAAVLAWEYTRAKRKDLEAKALERKAQDDLVDQVRAETELWQKEKVKQEELFVRMICKIDSLEEQLQAMQAERLRQNSTWWRAWAAK